jgi:ABC-type antimicrobial peptide transport system permease subunit
VLLAAIRRELLAMEPRLVLVGQQTMDRAIAMTLLPARVGAALAAGFSALGTLLAAIGLYGVIAYSVSRRTREIGIRMALGSGRAGVVRLVLSQGLVLTVAGLAVGTGLAAAVARLLRPVLFEIGPADPVAWTGALSVLLAAALAANVVPARRAARVDPAVAIRSE